MSTKVVIVGGLGYIGSALLELYRRQKDANVVVVDRRFDARAVAQLPDRCRFVQADMEDSVAMARALVGANVLHLLAAEVEAETSQDRADAIWLNNWTLAMQTAMQAPAGCRIMFPSSSCIFGGTKKDDEGMFEDDAEPCPIYPFGESKARVETWFRDTAALKPGVTWTLLRLGTNYGWAPGIRFNLVPNLFVKQAMQRHEINVIGDGLNYRPFCHTQDCARALLFLAGQPDAAGQIYHVASENWRIADLAEAVCKVVPGTQVLHVVPTGPTFGSYRMTSAKILRLGFAFRWDMARGMANLHDHLHCLEA